ncbi:MAG TPA: YfiR family protein [Burkholderiales bacterium]|nr:YfiR family protein [Burkholderiales bacterium]
MRAMAERHRARQIWRGRALALLALLAVAGWHGNAARAAESEVTLEQRVKAAFLFKMASYAEWPAGAFPKGETPFTIGVVGAEPIAAELSRIVQGRTAHHRPIAVRRASADDKLDGLHILFVGQEHRERIRRFAAGAQQQSTLLVTEWEGALDEGSMVNFVLAEGRVRFRVALDAIRKAGLKLSSRLLAVADEVRGAP